jgi:cation-transporting ATPase E
MSPVAGRAADASQVPLPGMVTPPSGLTDAEVSQRFGAGQTNATNVRTSRSIAEIVRANVFTVFNALLAALFVVTMATERWQNGLFGVVIVVNAGIGIVQEWRAKRILDRLALLNAPHARVVRNGTLLDVDVAAVVLDDLLEVRAGDQVPADGQVRDSWGLEVDESLLTGESEPVVKTAGHQIRSGSIVVAGQGRFQATAVGADAYATRLTVEARRFTVTYSELVADTNRLLRWISVTIALVAPVLIWSQFRSPDNHGWQDAVTGTVAALVGMVPEGLVLLTSLAFMIATIALARRSTLVQELPAVEALARVDVVCLDKTGTLTDGDVRFDRLELFSGSREADVRNALGLLARAGGANTTAAALATVMPVSPWRQVDTVAFSSARKWSAVVTDGHGSWVLGAPEMVLHSPVGKQQTSARERADAFAADGSRVLLLAHTDSGVRSDTGLPPNLLPDALVVLAEHLREDAEQTLGYFTEQGVTLKVISGDNPHTVGAVATMLHLPGLRSAADAADAVDARTLPQDTQELAEVLENHSVFGRVTPHQKRAMVVALQHRGHVVAMTGDGVNDALALKDADIGVAMGDGAAATRAVAQLVLLDGRFAHLPEVVAEGRRVVANIERAANLFLVKNVYSLVLAVIVAFTHTAYPFAPIQLTLISAITIGIPGFALALGPNHRRYVPGFLHRVLRFAIPVGIVTGVSAYAGYAATILLDRGSDVAQGRTTATLTVLIISMWTVLVLARPLTGWKLMLVAGLAVVVAVIVAVPALGQGIFLLEVTPLRLAIAAIIGAAGALLVELTHRSILLLVHLASKDPTTST